MCIFCYKFKIILKTSRKVILPAREGGELLYGILDVSRLQSFRDDVSTRSS